MLLDPLEREAPEVVAGARACVDAVAATAGPPDALHAWILTLLAWQVGHEAWTPWQALLEERVRAGQHLAGHPCCDAGSWTGPAAPEHVGGRVAATALYGMCLEFYYRCDRAIGGR